MSGILDRYRGLIDDWPAFCAALERPLPPVVWAHQQRIDDDLLGAGLAEDGLEPVPVPWSKGAFRLRADARPGRLWWYRAGLYHVQEEASLLPVRLLEPRPGDRVLDLCAAPGGKTAQIALALGNRGTVVANDRHRGRLAALRNAVARLGLLNVSITAVDGATFPGPDGSFDRVLVDAPCTAEGTLRTPGGRRRARDPEFRRWIAGIQRALLRRAVELCRPGGRVVYSTCTFAPEENEAVVDAVLRLGGLTVLPPPPLAIEHGPGLTAWDGERYDGRLAHTLRLWPHRSDTSGFFVAVLGREPPPTPSPHPAGVTPAAPPAVDPEADLGPIVRRFGLPEGIFDGMTFVRHGRYLRVIAADHRPASEATLRSIGVPFVRLGSRWPKLATAAALAFGRSARANVLELTTDEVEEYHARRSFPLAPGRREDVSPGDVLVRYRGFPLGLASFVAGPDGDRIESAFPKAWSHPG